MTTPSSAPRKLTNEKHINLYTVARQTRAGSLPWTFASRKPAATAGTVAADAVAIVAVVQGSAGPRLLVIREFRAPLGRHELSLPSGLVDEGESVETAGARELHEETGLSLSKIFHVSPPVASSAGLTDETVCLLYGEAEGTLARDFQTEHEDIEARLLSLDDIRALLLTPGSDVISSRLYPMLVGFVAAGSFHFPSLTR
jgi:ADP-ribose pyrophosphatase